MEFEKMQKIWDQQNERTVYAFDEEQLFNKVVKKQSSISKMVGCFEWTAILTFIGLAGFSFIEGINKAEYYQLPLSLLFIGLAVYMFRDRHQRLALLNSDTKTVKASVEHAITTLSYQIRRQKNIKWWFFIPLSLVAIYQNYFAETPMLWKTLLALTLMAGLYWLTQREIRCKFLPKRKELESIRELID